MADLSLTGGFDLPFQEQIDFFRKKLNLPTAAWDDIWQSAHDRAFVVAGATKADLLDDLRQAVEKAITDGTTLETFRQDFRKIVAARGWSGWTGEGTPGGFNWRTRVIYETNLRTSHAAGRAVQLADPGLQALLPYRRYVHNDSVLHPRPQHLAWNGLTLPHDHPFWKTHMPPNGWGCRCRVTAVLKPKPGDPTEPPTGWDDLDEKTGAPVGIDKGWAYAPGQSNVDELRRFAKEKVAKLPAPIAKPFADDVNKVISKPAFVEAKTTKAAAEWAVKNNLADRADYAGVHVDIANQWNRSLFDHLQEFPELRKNQHFVGTCQAQMAAWREAAIARRVESARALYPGRSDDDLRALAEIGIKTPKIKGSTWAHSTPDKDVGGIAVNKKWGGDPVRFNAALRDNVLSKYHPVGCDTVRSVVDHELGHQLDSLLGLHLDAEIQQAYKEALGKGIKDAFQGITNEVSGYAGKNIKEFVAECWAESLNNPTPRNFAARVAAIVRRRYFAKFGAA